MPKLFAGILAIFLLMKSTNALGQLQHTLQLKNGVQIGPGIVSAVPALRKAAGDDDRGPRIFVVDDGLRLIYVNSNRNTVLSQQEFTGAPDEKFVFPNGAVSKGLNAPAISRVLNISDFSKFGRREIDLALASRNISILQQITELTPTYAKLQILDKRTRAGSFAWDQRISPASIPTATLRSILMQLIDKGQSGDWLRVVDFYIQMQRFGEAREVLEEALELFPLGLKSQRRLLTQIDELYAQQKFDEIRLLWDSGQTNLAASLLQKFPSATLPLETQDKLATEIRSAQGLVLQTKSVVDTIRERFGKLPQDQQQSVQGVIDELAAEVTLTTVVRFSAFYQQIQAGGNAPDENLVALAIGGWLLGTDATVDNFEVAKSLVRVRDLVREYLVEKVPAKRDQIVAKLRSEEGAQPQYLARILKTMKPPKPLDPQPADQFPGLYATETQSVASGSVSYLVQVPPEYDPNHKYPCVLALGGNGDSLDSVIDWWCGRRLGTFRYGQMTRRGYIVVTPRWMMDDQSTYNYTEGEHDRVLSVYRDAIRRYSIDTDRVFIAGHLDGGTAAWDLAGAHPSLWAGLVAISPEPSKYIVKYWENLGGPDRGRPPFGSYFVFGSLDGTLASSDLFNVLSKYLEAYWFDCMVVEYRGNGRLRFGSELPKIADWMDLAGDVRLRTPGVRNPEAIDVGTMRNGDRFFYWLEAPGVQATSVVNPFMLSGQRPGKFVAKASRRDNRIVVSRIPSPRNSATIWLSPDLVDFAEPITVNVSGRKVRFPPEQTRPDIRVMLEDARVRGERQSTYWQRLVVE
ncbi:MAG TPA: hypothetical protein DDW52_11070 [Planctomycetaceae bacterium]|nr:hypothetical protein [Planctomycetaceae bacterium]